jgi:hypothetical protein
MPFEAAAMGEGAILSAPVAIGGAEGAMAAVVAAMAAGCVESLPLSQPAMPRAPISLIPQ